jgi:hypothetical protein
MAGAPPWRRLIEKNASPWIWIMVMTCNYLAQSSSPLPPTHNLALSHVNLLYNSFNLPRGCQQPGYIKFQSELKWSENFSSCDVDTNIFIKTHNYLPSNLSKNINLAFHHHTAVSSSGGWKRK